MRRVIFYAQFSLTIDVKCHRNVTHIRTNSRQFLVSRSVSIFFVQNLHFTFQISYFMVLTAEWKLIRTEKSLWPQSQTALLPSRHYTYASIHSLTSPHCSVTHRVGQLGSLHRCLFLGLLPRQCLSSTASEPAGPSTSLTQRTVLVRTPELPHVLLHGVHSLTLHL